MKRPRLTRARLITPYDNDPGSDREIIIRDLSIVPRVNELIMVTQWERWIVVGVEWRLDYAVEWDVEIRLQRIESP